MPYHDVPKKIQMEKFERVEPLHYDHTSQDIAKTCGLKYFYSMVLGFRTKSSQIYFSWGSSYHKFREVLESSIKDGSSEPEALKAASDAGLAIWDKEQGRDPEVGTRFDFLTRGRLVKSFLVAFQHWQAERKQGRIEVLDVEVPFNVRLPDGSVTSGRADQIVRWNGKLWGRDFKTSSRDGDMYTRGLSPNDQFTRYTFAESELCGEPVQGQLVEVLFNKKDHKTARGKSDVGPTIISHITSRNREEIERWINDTMMLNMTIDMWRNHDVWPMNEVSCTFCDFWQVCSKPSERARMEILESSEYVKRAWDNTKV